FLRPIYAYCTLSKKYDLTWPRVLKPTPCNNIESVVLELRAGETAVANLFTCFRANIGNRLTESCRHRRRAWGSEAHCPAGVCVIGELADEFEQQGWLARCVAADPQRGVVVAHRQEQQEGVYGRLLPWVSAFDMSRSPGHGIRVASGHAPSGSLSP